MIDAPIIEPGEELLARVGVAHAILRSTTPIHVYKKTPPIADDLEAGVRGFFAVKGPQIPTIRSPKLDYDEVIDALASMKPPASDAWKYIPGELVGPYVAAIARAKTYLNTVLPRATVTDLVSTRNLPPSHIQLMKFRRVWGVGQDPLVVLKAMREGTLVTDQAIALQAMFPTIFAFIQAAIGSEIVEYRIAAPNRPFPHAKDQVIQTLLLRNPGDPQEFARLQKNFADAKAMQGQEPAEPPTDKPGRGSRLAKDAETPIQRASK